MTTAILYDSHMHTPLCKHAIGEPEEYAAMAEKRGLRGIIFTCHNPGPPNWSANVRMSLAQFKEYVAMVERARQKWAGHVDVRLGLESDYMPGMETFLEKLHKQANFHHILGSVHPQLRYYRRKFFRHADVLAYQRIYFNHLAMAAETGLFDTLAHPDLIKNVFPNQWNIRVIQDDIRRSLDRIAQTEVAMEVNTSGLNRKMGEMHPNPFMLREIVARDIPVVLGSDAHEPKRVAADFDKALQRLQEVGFSEISFFLERRRYAVDLAEARESLVPTKRFKWPKRVLQMGD